MLKICLQLSKSGLHGPNGKKIFEVYAEQSTLAAYRKSGKIDYNSRLFLVII